MPRTKTNDGVLLEKWLNKPESEIRNRVLLLALNKIRALMAENQDLEDRTNDYSEVDVQTYIALGLPINQEVDKRA